MKINIIQFDPVVGGETTLCNAFVNILGIKHEIRVIHPVHLTKRGKLKKDKKWGKVKEEEFFEYSKVIDECENADYIFCINAKHVRGSVHSDKNAIAQADSDSFFEGFRNKNFIFYEHGFHTWRLYNYDKVFSDLLKRNNTIRVLTNTKMAIDVYKDRQYDAHLCRQPFDTSLYNPIIRNTSETVNLCFNSRYSTTKNPQIILPFFDKYLKKGFDFKLTFRGNVSDPVSVWHHIKHYFLDSENEIEIKEYANNISEVYDYQDYTIYAGYKTIEERGKIEYVLLESIFYDIPIIAHPNVFEYFKYDEYGITIEQLRKCFILLNDENLNKIINKKFDASEYVKNARFILDDFLPEKIIQRFENCISSPASKGRKKMELF